LPLFDSISRETTYITGIGRSLIRMRHVKPDSPITIVDIVSGFARHAPDSTAILYLDRRVSYGELEAGANRYAHWGASIGIHHGDVVALLMENRPEYLMAWLGLLKLGAIVALINTNLRGNPLAHSIGVAEARHLILDSELAENYSEARALIDHPPTTWATGGKVENCEDLDAALAAASPTPPNPAWRAGVTCKDKAFYIFTSGTTGLPKAANISHMRMLFMM
jgi:fatty-acyl-CoA synthase